MQCYLKFVKLGSFIPEKLRRDLRKMRATGITEHEYEMCLT